MSFFKAPSWAKPQLKDDGDDEQTESDMFSHSKNFMAIQQDRLEQQKRKKERSKQKEAEREQKRKEQLVKKESKAGIKRESPSADSGTEPAKKRRITSEESAKLLRLAGVGPITIDSDDEDEQIQYDEEDAVPVRRSPRTQRTRDALASGKGQSRLGGTAAMGEDSETESEVEITKATTIQPPEPEEDEDSDEEVAALARSARERHRLKKQQEEAQKSSTPGAAGSDGDAYSGLPTPPPPDPVISLLITSDIPNTDTLLVKRKLRQDLGTARRAWCQKWKLSDELSEKVFFTWCGMRMYDVTTCQRLGLEVDDSGNVVRADERDADGAAQVHVIATTQELLDQEKAEKAKQTRLDNAQYEPEEEAAPAEEEAPRKEVKIIVKAKDKPQVLVKVFEVSKSMTYDYFMRANIIVQTTKISKIVSYAKKKMGIANDQPAYLSFDGEHLDPESVVGDTEMEDMENVDLMLGN